MSDENKFCRSFAKILACSRGSKVTAFQIDFDAA